MRLPFKAGNSVKKTVRLPGSERWRRQRRRAILIRIAFGDNRRKPAHPRHSQPGRPLPAEPWSPEREAPGNPCSPRCSLFEPLSYAGQGNGADSHPWEGAERTAGSAAPAPAPQPPRILARLSQSGFAARAMPRPLGKSDYAALPAQFATAIGMGADTASST